MRNGRLKHATKLQEALEGFKKLGVGGVICTLGGTHDGGIEFKCSQDDGPLHSLKSGIGPHICRGRSVCGQQEVQKTSTKILRG